MLKKIRNRIGIFIIRQIGCLIYDPKYLTGRWFEETNLGWTWVLKGFFHQFVLGFNRQVPWPMCPFSKISNPKNIVFHPDGLDNFQSHGCYFQNYKARITLGKGTYIAPNVGIITANHDLSNLDLSVEGKDVTIGDNCWLGMGSVILPGVTLGAKTVVAAGAVVTKSFPAGKCVLAGVPAKMIKHL